MAHFGHGSEVLNAISELITTAPGADLLPPSASSTSTVITPSRDEIEEKRSELGPIRAGSEGNSFNANYDFPHSSIIDLLKCDEASSQATRGQPAQYCPRTIAFESRNAYLYSLRNGDTAASLEAIENGLQKLSVSWKYEKSFAWIAARIELLGTLERYDEAREELCRFDRGTRHGGRSHVAILDLEDSASTDAFYEDSYSKTHIALDLALWAQSHDRAREEAAKLPSGRTFFENYDCNPALRFEGLRRILNLGLVRENHAYATQAPARFDHFAEALRIYAEGCELTEIHRNYMEHPEARLISHDHVTCANLFFSAARICIRLHKEAYSARPIDIECQPVLAAPDWKNQALYFLERGRSRALLSMIERYEDAILPEQQRISVKEIVLEVRNDFISERRKSMAAVEAQMLDPSQICAPELSEEEIAKKLSAQDRQLCDMVVEIPKDTVIMEYCLASEKKPGLLVLGITSRGIEETFWEDRKTRSIREYIMLLNSKMVFGQEEQNEGRPTDVIETESRKVIKALCDILLSPFRLLLKTKQKLIIIPSGDLAHIPWTLLLQEAELQYLAVSLVPSFRIWYRLYRRSSESPPCPATATVVCKSPHLRMEDDELTFTRVESYYIARKHSTLPLLADKNKRESFEKKAENATIIHLSAHGDFNDEFPMLSWIDVFPERITVLDLTRLTTKAELVVFSSCFSAYSRVFDSGAAFSFAHVLLGNGARAFIGTLWPVGDVPCLLVMVLFYNNLRSGLTPASALAKAQLCLQTITEDDLNRLCGELLKIFEKDPKRTVKEYVVNYRYWIERRLGMEGFDQVSRKQRIEELKCLWCWGAFVLIGYGDRVIYGQAEV